MKPQTRAALGLIAAIALGFIFPEASKWVWSIKYFTMAMLTLAFLGVRFNFKVIEKSHFLLLAAMLGISTAAYFCLLPLGVQYAQLGWIVGLAPTAMSAPAFIAIIGGRVEYTSVSVVLTHLLTALALPLLLPIFGGSHGSVQTGQMLLSIAEVMIVPLIIVSCCQRLPQKTFQSILKLKKFSFPLWLIVLFIAAARSAQFFYSQKGITILTLLGILTISAVLCAINVFVGERIGGKDRHREAGQSLGQKNTTFVIWAAVTYISPFVAMGPMMYILCHNFYNSWQLYHHKDKSADSITVDSIRKENILVQDAPQQKIAAPIK